MTIKANSIRSLDQNGLQKKLDELQNELMLEMTQVKAGGRAPNPGRLRNLKKSIAIVLTVIQEKKLNIKRTIKQEPIVKKREEKVKKPKERTKEKKKSEEKPEEKKQQENKKEVDQKNA